MSIEHGRRSSALLEKVRMEAIAWFVDVSIPSLANFPTVESYSAINMAFAGTTFCTRGV